VFWVVERGEDQGLVAGDNLYCLTSNQSARFAHTTDILTFAEWTRRVGTDSSSMVAAGTDSRCQGW
jgi:hypothetical protein